MGKSRSNLFDLIIQGNQTISGTGAIWVDLGLIPNGTQIMVGYGDYTPDGKNITFDLRSNLSTKLAGTDAETTLHSRVVVRDGNNGSYDYYRNGRLQTLTIQSTGVEHLWMKLSAKSSASADAYWWIYYTTL